jgi:tRNA (guanine37-N1)-methyltransferase
MKFEIISIFPNAFDSYLNESLVKRAIQDKVISVRTHGLRDFLRDKKERVDARPFGGGPGMVVRIEPIYRAVRAVEGRKYAVGSIKGKKTRVILFSTRGKKLDAKMAKRLSKYDRLIMICGRYEGVDERVAEHIADEEISIGDYVLSGGELPALVLMEAVARFLPGFLGKYESLEDIKGYYPVYTRPEVFTPKAQRSKLNVKSPKGWAVPKVLLSGNHKEIDEWRKRT